MVIITCSLNFCFIIFNDIIVRGHVPQVGYRIGDDEISRRNAARNVNRHGGNPPSTFTAPALQMPRYNFDNHLIRLKL